MNASVKRGKKVAISIKFEQSFKQTANNKYDYYLRTIENKCVIFSKTRMTFLDSNFYDNYGPCIFQKLQQKSSVYLGSNHITLATADGGKGIVNWVIYCDNFPVLYELFPRSLLDELASLGYSILARMHSLLNLIVDTRCIE